MGRYTLSLPDCTFDFNIPINLIRGFKNLANFFGDFIHRVPRHDKFLPMEFYFSFHYRYNKFQLNGKKIFYLKKQYLDSM